MKKIADKALVRFLISALLIYILWYVVYTLWLHPWNKLDLMVINNLISSGSAILGFLNYDLIEYPYNETVRTMGIDGSHGLWIGDPCNGITLFALFAGFILAYPGKIKWKLVFIPFGLITIHLLNIFRIVALSLITFYTPQYLNFNHTYTFTIIIYSYVFMLWYFWTTREGFRNEKVNTNKKISSS